MRDGERWFASEGNGRLYAMREALGEDSAVLIEVEEYRFDRPHKIQRRLLRVRRLN
ncbi:hypothetical protein [Lysobacter sp. 1R34A]|uniref:hypothetical protein n=1 Tax=Lysobacter sp. 1R34A TaxID=3445786 RepID=UPI003EE9011F